MEITNEQKSSLYRMLLVFLTILSVFFVIKILSEFRSYGMMGRTVANTITLSGHGEIQAVPDIANIYFTITKEAKTVKEAQDQVAQVEEGVLAFLEESGVEDRDIQAANVSFYPKYQYNSRVMPCYGYDCQPGNSVIVGYTASESITVKVRNTDDVGKIMQGLAGLGIGELNGPNFAIDNEEGLKAEARKRAIADARAKAKVLAKDLGVRLGDVASFSESGYPIMYARDAMNMAVETKAAGAPTAQLPVGENTISSDVTITYEIR